MFRTSALLLGFACLAWCENGLTRQERKEGFELLFDGKTLAKWHSIKLQPGAGSWHARKGVLTYDKGESWLATDDTYYDFVLRLEYRTGAQSDSGIFLRSSASGVPAFTGMELQILSDSGKPATDRSTGSLYGAAPAGKSMANPDGEWNQVEVSVIKREISAIWNGEKILDVHLDDPNYQKALERPLAERLPYGHIGLQAHESGSPVEFRNIRIKVLRIGPNFSQDR